MGKKRKKKVWGGGGGRKEAEEAERDNMEGTCFQYSGEEGPSKAIP